VFSLGGTRWIDGGGWPYPGAGRQPLGRLDMLVHLPVLKMHERSTLTSPKIPEVLDGSSPVWIKDPTATILGAPFERTPWTSKP
jgi:hypothetical protein